MACKHDCVVHVLRCSCPAFSRYVVINFLQTYDEPWLMQICGERWVFWGGMVLKYHRPQGVKNVGVAAPLVPIIADIWLDLFRITP